MRMGKWKMSMINYRICSACTRFLIKCWHFDSHQVDDVKYCREISYAWVNQGQSTRRK